MDKLTLKQIEKLTNLKAFNVWFPGYEVMTYKPYGGKRRFYIVPIESPDPWNDYRYNADNLEHINGYLYGAVQAAAGQLIKATHEQINESILAL